MLIGVGITTRNRADVLKYTVEQHKKYTKGKIVIINDGGEPTGIENEICVEHGGIAKAKNECLRRLSDCDHVFLLDDDIFPLRDDWQDQYLKAHKEHNQQVLMWMTVRNGFEKNYGTISQYKRIQGVLFSLTRQAIDTAGGFNTAYGLYGYTDFGYIDRCKNLGLLPNGYCSINNADKYLFSLDCCRPFPEDFKLKFKPTLEREERNSDMKKNKDLYVDDSKKKYYFCIDEQPAIRT